MNNKGMSIIGVGLLLLGFVALYFIWNHGLIFDFVDFIRGLF